MRSRFAPSPTGDLHLGGAYIALAAWLKARVSGGQFVVRIEDIDFQRTVPGAVDRILSDLAWIGIDWDEGPDRAGPFGPYVQSERLPLYCDALDRLLRAGLVYPCTCTRLEIARIASAPHAGEEGPAYPGVCRDSARRRNDRTPAWRLRIPEDSRIVNFQDGCRGPQQQDVLSAVGDFVLRRADGQFSYQLAVVVDDLTMGITEVVRGDDLLPSTARQVLLARLLGGVPPAYAHLPMVLGPDGERLAKRHQTRWIGSTVAELRDAGVEPAEVLTALGTALGLMAGTASRPGRLLTARSALLDAAKSRPINPAGSWTVPERWVRLRNSTA